MAGGDSITVSDAKHEAFEDLYKTGSDKLGLRFN